MRIGLDIDGTLYNWTAAVNDAVRERFGVQGLGDHTHWNYLRDVLSPAEWAWVWSSDAAEPVFGRDDLAYSGADEAVNALCAEHEVHFVTHRNPRIFGEVTNRWLAARYSGYIGVHVLRSSVPKASLMGWDIFVDDKPETVEELARAGVRVLVPNRPWNQGAGAERFDDWRDVLAAAAEDFLDKAMDAALGFDFLVDGESEPAS